MNRRISAIFDIALILFNILFNNKLEKIESKKEVNVFIMSKYKNMYMNRINDIIEERLRVISIHLKSIINDTNNEIPIIIEDFIDDVTFVFISDINGDCVIEGIKSFIDENFNIKEIIKSFSDINKVKLNPIYRDEYKSTVRIKDEYLYKQSMNTKKRKEYRYYGI